MWPFWRSPPTTSCSTSPTAGWSSLPAWRRSGPSLRNALSLCRFLGYERPKAAALCAAETVSPRMPETGDAAALREEGSGETSAPAQWEGPISLDLATSAEAARLKGYCSPGGGGRGHPSRPLHRRRQSAGQGPLWAGRREDGRCGTGRLGAHRPQLPGASWEEKYNSILICTAMSRR